MYCVCISFVVISFCCHVVCCFQIKFIVVVLCFLGPLGIREKIMISQGLGHSSPLQSKSVLVSVLVKYWA